MKKQLILIFLFTYSLHCLSQSSSKNYYGRAYYGKSIILETKENVKQSPVNEFILEATRNATFVLDFSNEESVFNLEKKIELDGMDTRGAETVYGGGKGIYYSDRLNNYTIHQRDFGGMLYLIEGEFTSTKWKLHNESKKIQNYICYKAIGIKKILSSKTGEVTSIEIEAWYCPEIPIAYGPIGFNNLPGLILELKDRNATYYLKKIEFKDKNMIDIIKPKKGIKISETSFEILGKKAIEEKNERGRKEVYKKE